MSLRQLVDADCGGVNPLMQLGGQFTRDAARKDEGFMQQPFDQQFNKKSMPQDERMINEFLGQVAAPPQSFHMETLLQEMREIEKHSHGHQVQAAPRVIDEVTASGSGGNVWAKEFGRHPMQPPLPAMHNVYPQQQQTTYVNEFFDETGETTAPLMGPPRFRTAAPYLAIAPSFQTQQATSATSNFFNENDQITDQAQTETMENWINDYQVHKEEEAVSGQNYNEQFWQRLQDQWQKLSEETDHPWLSEYNENYDPYKEYEFLEENPMVETDNAFEKGKEYLGRGDIPSAVLCFEVAAKKEPKNAEIWELLGLSQAENEMDPQSIAALKRSLEIRPDNPRVLMALAVCYTNESLQSHALKMLSKWLEVNPKYKHLIANHKKETDEGSTAAAVAAFASSLITGSRLQEVQNLFLEAVRQNPTEVDADVQEALGVLYNLSAEFDKAVDCFRSALHVQPQNAKLWNRLGASLANGTRSVEAVEAYQQALQLEPGFIRVRYNVGVCCMNLKAYRQAVEHLLTALNMQANSSAIRELPAGVDGGQFKMSESIWSTLRMVISLMGRSDLHGLLTDRNLTALNEAFKD